MRTTALSVPAVAGLALLGFAYFGSGVQPAVAAEDRPGAWESRATTESQGPIEEVDGTKVQIRHSGFGNTYWGQFRTHAYDDDREPLPITKAEPPEGMTGDVAEGHKLITSRAHGPCTGCHAIPDPAIWPMGNVGPDLRLMGERNAPDSYLYQMIYDPRVIFGADSPMPPFGVNGMMDEQEIMHVVAYLQTLKGDPPGTPFETGDRQWNPYTRDVVRPEYGDPLDPFTNPGLAQADDVAVPLWSQQGPTGKSCADCHGGLEPADDLRPIGVIPEFEHVGATYPRWSEEHGRMMSVEDFLAVHGPEETGIELPAQGVENMTMSILMRMQSNGQPYQLDTDDANVQAAIKRGEALFHRPVGRRNHACADCHTERGGADKFLGGRFLANVTEGMVNHPYWRTAQQRMWDIRWRMQWCMTPLGTNYLPGDSPEYADLETYLIHMGQQNNSDYTVLVPRESH